MWIRKTVEVEVEVNLSDHEVIDQLSEDSIIEAAKQVIQYGGYYHTQELLDTIKEYAPDIIVSTAIELLQEYPELGKICGRGLTLWIEKWAKANPDDPRLP